MLSDRDKAIAAKKVSPELEQCSCSVTLVLLNEVPFLYNQVTDIRSRQMKAVVTGNPLENTHSYKSKYFATVLIVQET